MTLALARGLTHFLPIAGIVRLRESPGRLGWPAPDPASLVVIQIGTLAALLACSGEAIWIDHAG